MKRNFLLKYLIKQLLQKGKQKKQMRKILRIIDLPLVGRSREIERMEKKGYKIKEQKREERDLL